MAEGVAGYFLCNSLLLPIALNYLPPSSPSFLFFFFPLTACLALKCISNCTMSYCYMVPCHTGSPLIIQDPGKGAKNTARALYDLI